MTSRIPNIFNKNKSNNKKTFISYLVCGDPTKDITLSAMHTMSKYGVDIIELGIPFTDPIADGPTIQKSIDRSLKNNTSLHDVISVVKEFRKDNNDTAVVLMGYMNPVHKMGVAKFAKKINDKTIVITGAMIPYAFGSSSDGFFNLGSALSFVQTLERGIYIAMNGQYFNYNNVIKDKEKGYFKSL